MDDYGDDDDGDGDDGDDDGDDDDGGDDDDNSHHHLNDSDDHISTSGLLGGLTGLVMGTSN